MSHCVHHTDVEATFTCKRCGDYRCWDCFRPIGDRDLCVRCYGLELADTAASYWSISAALLGFFGLGCTPLGWIAIPLGITGLTLALRSGKKAGRGLACVGIGLGLIGTLIFAAAMSVAVGNAAEAEAAYGESFYGP